VLALALAVSTLWLGTSVPRVVASPPSGSGLSLAAARHNASLAITSFVANPPNVFQNARLLLNVTAEGGTPPYSYWYQGLPPGCATQNVSSLVCYPHDIQHYVVEVTVNDSAEDQVDATTNLNVTSGFGPAPWIKQFYAWPSHASVGDLTYLVVNAVSQSGTPTSVLAYAFLGLPLGCGTFNQSNLSCVPSQPGTYQIWVRVTDGYAQFNQTYLFLNVTGKVPSTSTSTAGSGFSTLDKEYVLLGVLAAVVVVGLVVYARFLRKPPPKAPVISPENIEFHPTDIP
jgi:hypothetical protein